MNGLDMLLHPGRVACNLDASSKKRIFEVAATAIAATVESLDEDTVYSQLLVREKLGSTGLGSGVAIPHCRVDGCESPVGCLFTLETAIDFDSPDDRPVDLLFILVVPAEATQEHLEILADLARRFSNEAYCTKLRTATSAAELEHSAKVTSLN